MDSLNPQALLTFMPPVLRRLSALLKSADRANAGYSASRDFSPVIWMTLFTMFFLAVQITHRSGIFQRIFTASHTLQMLWIDTGAIPASVINNVAIRDFSVSSEPSNAIRSSISTSKKKSPIPIFVKRTIPNPTEANDLVFRGESGRFFLSKMIHNWIVLSGIAQAFIITHGKQGHNGSHA